MREELCVPDLTIDKGSNKGGRRVREGSGLDSSLSPRYSSGTTGVGWVGKTDIGSLPSSHLHSTLDGPGTLPFRVDVRASPGQ